MSTFKNVNVLVCGASDGIGLQTAIEFASLEANVTLFARDEIKLNSILGKLKNNNNQHHKILVGDFNYPGQIRDIILDDLKDHKYNILINNSGGPKSGKIIDADISEFIETFNRHLICNHILVQSLLPNMIETNYGRIINIISTSVKQPIIGLGVSNTIRSAVAAWSKTLSLEICKDGITINNILPGFTHTGRLDEIIKAKAIQSGLDINEVTDNLKKEVPLNRFADSKEIAKLILYIASKDSAYINGVSIPIDGGRLKSF